MSDSQHKDGNKMSLKNSPQGKEDLNGDEVQATKEECQAFLQRILDKISSRFVKKYLPPLENVLEETQFFIPVEFYECKNKLPVPEHKVVVIFKILRVLQKEGIFFQIENESVSYPLFSSNFKFKWRNKKIIYNYR